MNRTVLILGAAAILTAVAVTFGGTGGRPGAPAVGEPTRPQLAVPTKLPAAPAFTPGAPPATGGQPVQFTGRTLSPYLLRSGGEAFLQLELTAEAIQDEKKVRAPVNLALVIDRSGSMRGDKIQRAREAAVQFIQRLEPTDRLAIVDYASDVTVFPSTVVGEGREAMLTYARGLVDSSGTNISGGLERGGNEVSRFASDYQSSRIILISDGQPTEGVRTAQGLGELAGHIRGGGVAVTALGVGTDFDAQVMRTIAEYGGGFSGNIHDAAQLAEIFGRELNQASTLLAKAVELSIVPAAGVLVTSVAGTRFTPRGDGSVTIPVYDLASGGTARFLVKLSTDGRSGDDRALAQVTLRYRDVRSEVDREAALSLGAKLTDDVLTVNDHADPAVRATLVRAQAAEQMKVAAAAYRRGDRESAFQGMDSIRRMFGASADALAGNAAVSDALRGDEQEMEKQLNKMKGLNNFGDTNAAANDLDGKSLKHFGATNSY